MPCCFVPFTSVGFPTSSGSVVNQVERDFNGLGQLTREWQEHSGTLQHHYPTLGERSHRP
jgi:hypothetical protein